MDFIILITLISAIFCSKNRLINILKEIDKNTFDLKVADITPDIVFTIKSNDYMPVFCSCHVEDACISFDDLFIGNFCVYEWISMNITDHEKLTDFINNSVNMNFVFKMMKKNLEESGYNFEFRLEAIRKNDFKNIWAEYLKTIANVNPSDEYVKGLIHFEISEKILEKEITCSFKYANNSCAKPDFDNYEVVAYELVKNIKNKKIVSEKKLESFKQKLFYIGKNSLIGLAIFGPCALILHFVLARYFIK